MTKTDFDLERFVHAQDRVYEDVVTELRSGRKRSHWIWFVFPQATGLGSSEMSKRYAIGSLDEALAYFEHPVLGPRLVECRDLVLAANDTLEVVLGDLDAMKFRSCMSLFAEATGETAFVIEA